MCGRFILTTDVDGVARLLGVPIPAEDAMRGWDEPVRCKRYNAAPGQPVLAATSAGLTPMHWGFVPHWASDPGTSRRHVNARVESAGDKPSFRDAFHAEPGDPVAGRCIIPADGFFEWQVGASGAKRPVLVRRAHTMMLFAGLWSRTAQGETTCVILTCDPNPLLARLHDRMPVILEPDASQGFAAGEPASMAQLTTPLAQHDLTLTPVSTRVNSVDNDDPQVVEPIGTFEDEGWEPQGLLF